MFPFFNTWRILPPWAQSKFAETCSSLETVFELDGKIISKSSQSEIFSHTFEGKTFFIKRYFRSKNISSWLGFSRFQLEARNQLWFNQQGIASAQVVAYGEQRFLMKTLRGVLITEGVSDARELSEIAENSPEKLLDKKWINATILQLAQIISRLHQARFCHNDLHWRNLLIQQATTSQIPRVLLIDCPSGKKLFGPLLGYRKLKDLASLDKLGAKYLSQTQRLRFFLAYRDTKKLALEDKKMILGVLQHKANRLQRKAKQKK
jgi:tRNA A-37 threonylcarbamoyl transferase component Bud32